MSNILYYGYSEESTKGRYKKILLDEFVYVDIDNVILPTDDI